MPHKAAVCTYCDRPMSIGRVHPSMTPYHGECRMAHLRTRWVDAGEAERALIMREVGLIKPYLRPTETP